MRNYRKEVLQVQVVLCRLLLLIQLYKEHHLLIVGQEQGAVDVGCEFCNRRYRFDPVDIQALFSGELTLPGRRTRH